ncbi:hypothetical protein DXG01_009006 [Tephrocybe rancida]|nr:hypothetical protein DXG01_009006 [Tephrocybe rancida]
MAPCVQSLEIYTNTGVALHTKGQEAVRKRVPTEKKRVTEYFVNADQEFGMKHSKFKNLGPTARVSFDDPSSS